MVRGILWIAFCVIALFDAIQFDKPQKRIETQQRKLLTGPEDSLNFVGTNVIFTCQSTLRSCVKLTWYQDFSFFSASISDKCPLEKGRCFVENTTLGCRLTFTNVQLKDAGYFYCKLVIGDQSFEGRNARLTVTNTSQANALKGPSDQTAPIGYVVTFTCISPLEGCIGMDWYKDTPETVKVAIFGEPDSFLFEIRPKYIVANATHTLGCRLTITDVKPEDTGYVYCRISVSERLIERSAVLLVPETNGSPLRGPEDVLYLVGTNAVFTCESTLRSCNKLTWHKDKSSFFWTDSIDIILSEKCQLEKGRCIVQKTALGCRLTLKNVQLSDIGYFFCKLDVGDQSFRGRTARLIVTRQADALRGPSDSLSTVGQYASFTCLSAFGNCRGMSWYKDTPETDRVAIFGGEKIGIYLRDKYSVEDATQGCQLTITNLELRDTGTVYCQIQISGTAVENWATLLVFEGRIENPLKGPDDSVNFINTTAVFTCMSPLRSCVKINWYMGTDLIKLNDPNFHLRDRYVLENTTMGCRLIIGSVRVNDAGYFICEIVLGRTSYKGRTAQLTVINTPQPCDLDISLLRLSDNFSTPGLDVSFTCVSPLKSCVGINWYKDVPRYYRHPIFTDGKVIYLEDKYNVKNSTSGCELLIKRAEYKDVGVVVCEMLISQRPYEVAAYLHVFETNSQTISLNFVDTNATFTCDSPLGDCANMIWYIDDLPSIFGPEFVPVYDVDSTVKDRWTIQKTSSGCKLTLINVQLNDAGHVYCEIMLGGRPFRGGTTNFTVFSRRRPDETEDYDYEEKGPTTGEQGRRRPDETEDYDYDETEEQDEEDAIEGLLDFHSAPGEDATFTCISPLRNCIEMIWYKEQLRTNRVVIFDQHKGIYLRDKYIVESSNEGCELTVKNVERADAGTFHCQIVISQITHTRSAILFIDGVINHEMIG